MLESSKLLDDTESLYLDCEQIQQLHPIYQCLCRIFLYFHLVNFRGPAIFYLFLLLILYYIFGCFFSTIACLQTRNPIKYLFSTFQSRFRFKMKPLLFNLISLKIRFYVATANIESPSPIQILVFPHMYFIESVYIYKDTDKSSK